MVTTRTPLPEIEDTIVALASAAGPGPRAIVRLSGRQAARIAASVFPGFTREPAGRQLVQGQLIVPGVHAPLPADLLFFPGPHSYTGQDVVELHTLSSPPLVEALVAACLAAGARAAQSGEFTLRAFLAGKLDLTRAEAVLGVIEAGSRDELKHALAQLAGGMAQPLHVIREDLLNLLADVEARLDFADDEVPPVAQEELLHRLTRALAQLTNVRRQVESRALARRPFRAVLAGRPNAGKSSLFNALAGRSAALVSAEPGTTRDYLETTLDIDGVAVQLVDTAGLRVSADGIETVAQHLGREQAAQADLLLSCIECGRAEAPDLAPPAAQVLHVATKCDLAAPPTDMLATSATTGHGLAALRKALAERARDRASAGLAPSLSRCQHHIDACLDHLRQAHHVVLHEEMPELLALELRLALEELGAMVGAVYTDDLLDRIFSRFCIGK